MISEAAFYVLASLSIASAAGVVLLRNPVHSAMSLVLALFMVAVSYVVLQAHLVAALQIIVYTGAVMVLFLFVIMLLNLQADPQEAPHPAVRGASLISAAVMAAAAAVLLWDWAADGAAAQLSAEFGTTKALARVLFNDHLVAFELTSVLLLVAIVGAVVLARREQG